MKSNLNAAQISTAHEIANCPAFWNSLNDIEKEVIRTILAAKKGTISEVPTTSEELYPAIASRYITEVRHPSDKVRQEAQAVLHSAPETAWSDTDIFEVNYPDNIQVQIDRTIGGEIQVRVWKIGDDEPLRTMNVHLPGLPSAEDETFLVHLRQCLLSDYHDVRIYDDYDPANPEDATFIVMDGPWSIRKDGKLFVLEATVVSHGDSVTPSHQDPVDVDKYNDAWGLAQRILIEDAKARIENRISGLYESSLPAEDPSRF